MTAPGPDPAPRERVYQTRPGTAMIGPYSVHQMDDFYAALAVGQVRPSGIMNYVQRLYIADRCPAGAKVVDVCCGRALQLPVLYRYAPHVSLYVGLDIAPANIAEAWVRTAQLDEHYGGRPFDVEFIECDVSGTWPDVGPCDVAVYTSALEHLPPEAAVASLLQCAAALGEDGRLFLSTPNSVGEQPRLLQHGVHVHEWNEQELRPVLAEAGFVIEEIVGLNPPAPQVVSGALVERFGPGAAEWYEELRRVMPGQFLDTVAAAAVPDVALEQLYVCTRRSR